MSRYLNQRFGEYLLVRLIGSGGFAEVYEAQNIYLPGTKFAIKLLKDAFSAGQMEDLRKEAFIVNSLDHSHIVRLLTFNVEHSTPYLAMPYATGGSLDQNIPEVHLFRLLRC